MITYLLQKQTNSLEGIILSGRAAFTAGKDEVSGSEDESEEESNQNGQGSHTFRHTDKSVRALLDSGAIPDAAVIYAARKKRQQVKLCRRLFKYSFFFDVYFII